MPKLYALVFYFLVCALPFLPGPAAFAQTKIGEASQNSLLVASGPVSTLFSWDRTTCSRNFAADTPARAFRRGNNTVVLYATHYDNWMLTGPSLQTVAQDCEATMPLRSYQSSAAGRLWIEATYTLDGIHITALTSQDLTSEVVSSGCNKLGNGNNCWLNHISSATSSNSGKTYEPDKEPVAIGVDQYDSRRMGRQGFFTVSNIVGKDGQYYFISAQHGIDGTPAGNCLFSTKTVLNSESWKAWDGTAFSASLRGVTATKPACAVVGAGRLLGEVRSLSYLAKRGTWLALFLSARAPGRTDSQPGIYASTSSDLLHWEQPFLVLGTNSLEQDPAHPYTIMYPSLMDPDSHSRNFDTVDGAHPDLFFVKYYKGAAAKSARNRDICYVPMRLR